ncbi:MAG: glycosyltransferase, partial [Mycoplasmataceae bacterium]|nr:glycosyltransferase [Mycoplasmataceae bacterium]
NNLLHYIFSRKVIRNLLKVKKYDLILNSTDVFCNKNISTKNNYFLIQHNPLELYKFKINKGFFAFIKRIIKKIFGARFAFDKTKNIILFDNKNKDLYWKSFKENNNPNIYCISLCSKNKQDVNIKKIIMYRKNIICFGRFTEQKNIKEIIRINNTINKVDFYGPKPSHLDKYGTNVFNFIEEKNWYKGVLDQDNLYTTINKYKFSINYSLFEGFGFSIVESLSCGVPVIVRDSFTSASFLTSYDHRLLIPKNATNEEAIKQINSLLNLSNEEYLELCKKAFKFFQENLSYEIFEKKWLEIFNKFLN